MSRVRGDAVRGSRSRWGERLRVGESTELARTYVCLRGSSKRGVRRRVLTLPEEEDGRENSFSCWR